MKFELTDEVCNLIIFAMEDQGERYLFDSMDIVVVKKVDVAEMDADRYYSLPVWDSVRGFKVMERFVSMLRNPLAREQLRAVLFAGKGVFRNFKNVLKEYPEVEKLWFSFKESQLKQSILSWYNVLCDSWGLEHIGVEPEETEDVLYDDFVFRQFSERDSETLFWAANTIVQELESKYKGDFGSAIAQLWQQQRGESDPKTEFTMIVETVEGDFAGCITASPYPEESRYTVLITSFFVMPSYRGLGLGKELLHVCLNELKGRGVRWVLTGGMTIPETFVKTMQRNGFIRDGSVFFADLCLGMQ